MVAYSCTTMMYRTEFSIIICLLAAYIATSMSLASDSQAAQQSSRSTDTRPVVIFMSGDVMTGRAIDQLLPYHNDPVLYERYIRDARDYILLAEKANGPVPRPVNCEYIWGDALHVLTAIEPDVRLINLETSITRNDQFWKRKYIHYRMHPENAECLAVAKIDFTSLANNHVLDWHYAGLQETLRTLETAEIKFAGAGRDITTATRPAIIDLADEGRVIISSWAHADSGVPPDWAATQHRPGVNRLNDLSSHAVNRIRDTIKTYQQPGDIVVVSIHWGGNWGYDIAAEQTRFAHRLIDEADVDIIHGHSSHHVKAIEVYKDKLILYGSGDLLNDYEGIGGHEEYRSDLSLMYFASVEPGSGKLAGLKMVPTQIRKLRINSAEHSDALWLNNILNREGRQFGTSTRLNRHNHLILDW